MAMTYTEFVAALARLSHQGWEVNESGEIRGENCRCPITAVCAAQGAYYPTEQAHDAGRYLGMTPHTTYTVVLAADTRDSDHTARDDMLDALGLDEGDWT